MKRILHIVEPLAGGIMSFLQDITKLQVCKYEVYIIYGIRPQTPPNVECLFDKRVHLIRLDSFKGALGTVLNPKAYFDVYRLYKQIDPDIVHLHSSASGFVGRLAIPCRKNKVFYTPHGYSFLMQDVSRVKRVLYWLIEKVSAQLKSTTIACGWGEYQEALKLSKKSTFVNNGINIETLTPYVKDVERIHPPVKICTSGRVVFQKNPKLFNEIAVLLPNAEFFWIGTGDMESELTSPNIKVTGWTDRITALNILQNADIFILTSLWEGLPIALLEAMYLKKICLISNVIGNRDVIESGRNGIICNTAEDYVNAINGLVNGSLDGKKMADQAHVDVETKYSVWQMEKKYDEIYKR